MNTSKPVAPEATNSNAVELDDAALETVAGGGCTDGDLRKNKAGIWQVCEGGKWENAGINI